MPPKTTISGFIAHNRAMTKGNKKELVKRTIRIPQTLADEIHHAASQRNVSDNTEIVDRLKAAVAADRHDDIAADVAELKAMIRRVLAAVS